jgi:quercetin dioxygenase-like cupin family protein
MTDQEDKTPEAPEMSGADYTFFDDVSELVSHIPPDTIISRTFYGDDNLKAILFGFAQGQELSEHTAARPAILHFISGEAELILAEDKFEARPGTWVHMPAHLPHSVFAKTKTVMVLLLLS